MEPRNPLSRRCTSDLAPLSNRRFALGTFQNSCALDHGRRKGPPMKSNKLRSWAPVLLGVLLVNGTSGRARAEILLETADFSNALTPAYVVGQGQTLGARFHVSGTVAVDHIGAHFVKTDGGTIYGAIASPSGSPGLPAGAPGSFNPIAETTFTVNAWTDQSVALSATLGAGDYAVLLFGSNRFGATGSAAV